MTRKYSIISILLTFSCLTACGGDDNGNDSPGVSQAVINLSKSSLEFTGEAGEQSVTLTANHEWAAVTSDSWITVSPENSTLQNATLTVKVQKNGNYDSREGMVTIMAGTAREYIKVTQAGGDGIPDPSAITCPLDGYKLVWNDEFDSGSYPDGDLWTYQEANPGWVNNELQTYVREKTPAGTRVADLKDGRLRIKCFKEDGKVYSARLYGNVRTGWTYGYIEAKIKLPKGKGTWPAFWMMPVKFTAWPDDGEIDIMEEVGTNPNYVSSSLHALGHYHANNTQVTKERYLAGAEDDFHVYAVEWTSQYIQTYVDGEKLLYYENDGSGKRNWPYNEPFYVILNLAWGGSWGGMNGVDEGALPCTMEVEYVRVFQKK